MTYSIDEITAACKRFAAAGLSWEQMVEGILHLVAEIAADCRNRRLSLAEIDMSRGNQLKLGLAVLGEYYRGGYCGYRISPKIYSDEMNHIFAAIREAQRIGRERLTDQSSQARAGEAQVSARHVEGTDQQAGLSNLPRLHAFPNAKDFAKTDCGERLMDYMETDLHLNPPQHEYESRLLGGSSAQADMLPGYPEMVETLAHDETNLFEHPNPRARIKLALARKADRQRMMHDKRWGQSPERPDGEDTNDFFDAQQSAWLGGLHQDKDTVRNAAHTAESNTIADLDLKQALETLKESGVTQDHIRVAKAIGNGLNPRSANAHRVLGMKRRDYERIRRSLASDRGPGRALQSLRDQLAIYLQSAPRPK